MKHKKRILAVLGIVLMAILCSVLCVPSLRTEASGWIDEATSTIAEYAKYPLQHYQLDFYVDTSWSWLPWNWGEGIGESLIYGVYMITNAIWGINIYLCYLVGYVVEQAYNLDFISSAITQLSTNMQNIMGVSSSGFKSHGLLPSFLPIFIVIAGGYFAYLGLVKRQLSKAVSFLMTFVIIAVFGIGFVAYSDKYLGMINDFQKEFNNEVLTIGSMITVGDDGAEDDPVTAIRDSLFEIQIKKPYLLLQYGDSDVDVIGQDRIDELLSEDPYDKDSEREDIVEKEVDDLDNGNMSVNYVAQRLGMVFIILISNIVISICVGILVGIMIFSQILFVLYAIFLVVAIVFSLLPGQTSNLSNAFMKVFNAIFQKAGITLILTVVFSISSMCYLLTSGGNFFWMMFLQIVVFVGSVLKSNDLLGFMSLGNKDSGGMNKVFGLLAARSLMKAPKLLGAGNGRRGGGLEQKPDNNNGDNNTGKDKPTRNTRNNKAKLNREEVNGKTNLKARDENNSKQNDNNGTVKKPVSNNVAEVNKRKRVPNINQSVVKGNSESGANVNYGKEGSNSKRMTDNMRNAQSRRMQNYRRNVQQPKNGSVKYGEGGSNSKSASDNAKKTQSKKMQNYRHNVQQSKNGGVNYGEGGSNSKSVTDSKSIRNTQSHKKGIVRVQKNMNRGEKE